MFAVENHNRKRRKGEMKLRIVPRKLLHKRRLSISVKSISLGQY